MHQTISGKPVYVVAFDVMPELPIVGLTESEAVWENLLDQMMGGALNRSHLLVQRKTTGRVALALHDAIKTGVITTPGKYGIYLVPGTERYEIYTVIEE